jgi:hypothetical protein
MCIDDQSGKSCINFFAYFQNFCAPSYYSLCSTKEIGETPQLKLKVPFAKKQLRDLSECDFVEPFNC